LNQQSAVQFLLISILFNFAGKLKAKKSDLYRDLKEFVMDVVKRD
jgi:hypothetical protein